MTCPLELTKSCRQWKRSKNLTHCVGDRKERRVFFQFGNPYIHQAERVCSYIPAQGDNSIALRKTARVAQRKWTERQAGSSLRRWCLRTSRSPRIRVTGVIPAARPTAVGIRTSSFFSHLYIRVYIFHSPVLLHFFVSHMYVNACFSRSKCYTHVCVWEDISFLLYIIDTKKFWMSNFCFFYLKPLLDWIKNLLLQIMNVKYYRYVLGFKEEVVISPSEWKFKLITLVGSYILS